MAFKGINMATTVFANNLDVTVPTVGNGDAMLFIVSQDGANASPTTPTGWTQIGIGIGNAAGHLDAYYRIASSEPASYNVAGLSPRAVAAILTYGNSIIAAPHNDTVAILNVTPTPVTYTIAAHAVAINNWVVYALAAHWGANPTSLTITDPASAVNRGYLQSTNSFGLSISDEYVKDTSETSRSGTAAWTSATNDNGAMLRIVFANPNQTPDHWGWIN